MEKSSLSLFLFLLPHLSCSGRRNVDVQDRPSFNFDSDGRRPLDRDVHHRPRLSQLRRPPENCSDGPGETFLWRIDTVPPSYFFGTIHVPYTRVWDQIPANTKKAFKASDKVYFELDLTNPYTIAALTSCQLLPRGLNLSQVLPPDVYTRLKSHLSWVKGQMSSWMTSDQAGMGLYADYLYNAITGNWERKRPVWAMLLVNSLTPSDIASRGFPVLDLYLAQIAEKQNKKIGAVERVEEQCLPLNGLTYGQVIFALNQTLQQHEDIRYGRTKPQSTTDDLIKNYQCGNLSSVIFNQDTAQVPNLTVRHHLSIGEKRIANEIDLYFRDHLIYKRNRRMGSRVVELLLNNPGSSFFFAFGAGHFVGENTILDVVRNAGFNVEHVHPNDDLDRWTQNAGQRRHNKGKKHKVRKGTVTGTFDDLSDEEKTKAFLQLLEFKEKVENKQKNEKREKERKDNSFHELWQKLPVHHTDPGTKETEEEKTVRQSIQVWYGISGASDNVASLYHQHLILVLLAFYFIHI